MSHGRFLYNFLDCWVAVIKSQLFFVLGKIMFNFSNTNFILVLRIITAFQCRNTHLTSP